MAVSMGRALNSMQVVIVGAGPYDLEHVSRRARHHVRMLLLGSQPENGEFRVSTAVQLWRSV